MLCQAGSRSSLLFYACCPVSLVLVCGSHSCLCLFCGHGLTVRCVVSVIVVVVLLKKKKKNNFCTRFVSHVVMRGVVTYGIREIQPCDCGSPGFPL
jgi:hypothetical protein